MENLDVLYEILLQMCQWWNVEHPGLFLMKIHPVERKLYHIINGGTTALVYDESYFIDQPVICKDIKPNKPKNLCTAYLYSPMYLIYWGNISGLLREWKKQDCQNNTGSGLICVL